WIVSRKIDLTNFKDRFEAAFEEKNGEVFQNISKMENIAVHSIKWLFFRQAVSNVAPEVKGLNLTHTFSLDYYKNAIKELGWEENIVEHFEDINNLFHDFDWTDSDKYLKHYLTLLTEQTGLHFPYDEIDRGEMEKEYLYYRGADLEKSIRKALRKANRQDVQS